MGCVAATAKRRRKQAVGGYMNMDPKRRPKYAKHGADTWERRAAQQKEKRANLEARKSRRRA